MPNYLRDIFLRILPRLLVMSRPKRIPLYGGRFVDEYDIEEIFDKNLVAPSLPGTMLPLSQVGRYQKKSTVSASNVISKSDSLNNYGSPGPWHKRFTASDNEAPDQKWEKKRRKSTFGHSALAQFVQTGTDILGGLNPNIAYHQRVEREIQTSLDSIAYIAEHMKAEVSDKKVV